MGVRDFTLFDGLERNAELHGSRVAVVFEGQRITHGELLGRAERLAAGLAAAGLGRGDRVAVIAQNRPEIVDLLGAAARLGAILVPVNWRLEADEIAHVIADAGPTLVVAESPFVPAPDAMRAAHPDVAAWFGFDEPPPGFAAFGELADGTAALPATEVGADDPVVMIHTAAVAGASRGAVLTHANLVAQNGELARAWALGPADVALAVLPLFHVSGLGLLVAVQAAGGASVIQRRFDAAAAAAAIETEGASVLFAFAPMLGQILDAAGPHAGRRLASLRAASGLESADTIARLERTCPGARFWSGYGQSEVSGFVTFSPQADQPGSAGRPIGLARIAILGDEGGPAPPGTVGEIAVRGPTVFAGYWGRPDDNDFTLRDGWHHTGDMGRLDPDGFLFYAGRSPAKELIKTGGENVYPAEVERALQAHPGIAAAVVLGVPDPQWGEAVKAVCVRASGAAVEADELVAFVGSRIARFKRPKQVVFVDALPTDAAGRPDRAQIKAEHGAR